ncbi:AAA family ATPase [Brenneria goodwinii]|uniref:AAA family ATPase n=1 Tax=Brenneria goodwinii TaxID=1109412 RepID=UPI00287774EE|nr:AAA family ATPase [Brenneria goodwinii]
MSIWYEKGESGTFTQRRGSAIRSLETLKFHPKITFFIGENGSGKSTLLESLAVSMGFNPEGGTKNFNHDLPVQRRGYSAGGL